MTNKDSHIRNLEIKDKDIDMELIWIWDKLHEAEKAMFEVRKSFMVLATHIRKKELENGEI